MWLFALAEIRVGIPPSTHALRADCNSITHVADICKRAVSVSKKNIRHSCTQSVKSHTLKLDTRVSYQRITAMPLATRAARDARDRLADTSEQIFIRRNHTMFNGCGGCGDIMLLLLLCCCCGGGYDCGCKKGCDCKDIFLLYILMCCCGGRDKCCC